MMQIRNLFINPEERRLRAAWRILVQSILFWGGAIVVGIGIGLVILLAGLLTGRPVNPGSLAEVSASPWVLLLSSVLSLVMILVSYAISAPWIDRRPLRDYGFHFGRAWWMDFLFGLGLGALLMTFIFFVERLAGWVTIGGVMQSARPGWGFWTGIFFSIVIFGCVGIYEEMLARGYILRNLAEGLNFQAIHPRTALILAYLLSSIFFGLLHINNPNASLVSTLNLMIAGLFLGLGYVLTGELAIPIGLHITWNFFQGCVFGFPVSGLSTNASFIQPVQSGPEVWTGGAFGPEAGLIGLVAMILGSLLIVGWIRARSGSATLKDHLAIYPSTSASRAASSASERVLGLEK